MTTADNALTTPHARAAGQDLHVYADGFVRWTDSGEGWQGRVKALVEDIEATYARMGRIVVSRFDGALRVDSVVAREA